MLCRRKGQVVEAERVSERTEYPYPGGVDVAEPGDWVVHIAPDIDMAFSDERFKQEYEAVVDWQPGGVIRYMPEREYVETGPVWHGVVWFMFFALGWFAAWLLGAVFGWLNPLLRLLGVL